MTKTKWFASRNGFQGVEVTEFDTDGSSVREQEAIAKLLDTIELGSRAAKAAR